MMKKKLGKGIFHVYKTTYFGLKVAIKVINVINDMVDNINITSFLDNYNKIKLLNSNEIIYIYGCYPDNKKQTLNIVMELCEFSLNTYFQSLRKKKIGDDVVYPIVPIKKKMEIFNQILCGMNYLQINNVRHLDLKPSNILLTSCLNVKISDFDFSEYSGEDKGEELGKTISRITYEYAAPEFVTINKYYPNSDVFSFGLVLYYLIFERDCWNPDYKIPPEVIKNEIKNYYEDKEKQQKPLNEKIMEELKRKDENREIKYEKPLLNIFDQCFKIETNDRKTFQEISNTNFTKDILDYDSKCTVESVEDATNAIWEKSIKNCKKKVDGKIAYDTLFQYMEEYFNTGIDIKNKDLDFYKKYIYSQMLKKKQLSYSRRVYDKSCSSSTKDIKEHGIDLEDFKYFMYLFGHVLVKEAVNERGKDIHPFDYLYDNLWGKSWYFDANNGEETKKFFQLERERFRKKI